MNENFTTTWFASVKEKFETAFNQNFASSGSGSDGKPSLYKSQI